MGRLIQAENIVKCFHEKKQRVLAVDHVSLHLDEGEILGIIGESGSGKSTILRLLSGIIQSDEGQVTLFGKSLDRKDRSRFQNIQMIFQDARASFDKQYTIEQSLNEVRKYLNPNALENRFLLQEVGLDSTFAKKYPYEMSGGECQRAAIARALVCDPKVLLCDEITSALDVSVQKQILELLKKLQKDLGLSYLFIGHDLAVVQDISQKIVVMYMGEIVEELDSVDLKSKAKHPYTKLLLNSVFEIDKI